MYRIARATALPADAIDDSQKSENAGGGSEPGTDTPTVDLDKGDAIPATGAYNLIGSVDNLGKLTTAQVEGATTITARDGVDNLLKTDVVTKAVLAFTDNVTVEDTLQNLALKDTSGLTVNKTVVKAPVPKDGAEVDLGTVTVAEASGAQAKIDAFLARTDVDYTTNKLTPPTTLKVGDYSIEDSAAAIAAADPTVLADAVDGGVIVKDSMGNIANLSSGLFVDIDAFTVNDTLANITGSSEALLTQITSKPSSTITATDTTTASAMLSTAMISLLDGSSGAKTIDLDSLANTGTLNIELEGDPSAGVTLNLSTSKLFANVKSSVTINITGSDGLDTITAGANGGRIDGNGGGKDNIALGSGNDTLVLGNGWTLAKTPTGSSDDSNSVQVTKFNNAGTDKIALDGLFASFTSGSVSTTKISVASASLANNVGKVLFFAEDDATSLTDYDGSGKGLYGLKKGENAIVVISSNTASKIYYIEESGDADGITAAKDFVIEIASFSDKVITSVDFDGVPFA